MLLIGLGHRARQGKNFVANYMIEEATRGLEANSYDELVDKYITTAPKLYAFADELKLYCKEHHDEIVLQWKQAMPMGMKLNPPKDDPIYGYTQILQWYGTDVARKQNPNTWVEALESRLKQDQPECAIVTDVRFSNEATFIKENGGFMVEVRRHNADGTQYIDSGRDPNHPSEIALDEYEDWDYVIVAKDGDLKGLKAKSIGVYNLISKPEDYLGYIEDYPEYTKGIEGMVDISELPADSDIFSFVDEPDVLDSDGTGFKS